MSHIFVIKAIQLCLQINILKLIQGFKKTKAFQVTPNKTQGSPGSCLKPHPKRDQEFLQQLRKEYKVLSQPTLQLENHEL